ncbi:hypothetical protein AWB85_24170 [Mycobacteroides immunogenum]|uniref:Double-GTPase 1 domain-containing protein n=1 Tax=Mycobacteroides immunogenum TaxID=83262 RepID=A0A179VAP0_9MYCO|nr:hypothetical protein [Mycobacteroides immunogenum]OAT68667.1 hypothetical protein AWB85_24170 [Mycobacteroides immunogenum]
MSKDSDQILVLGGPSSGKSTFLMQLYGRAASGECSLTIRSAPTSLSAVSEGWKRLQQGLPPAHTPHGTDTVLTLETVDKESRHVDITIPDYAGEDLQRMGEARRVSERWRELASTSDHWVVMVRLSQYLDIPDLISRPIGELASADHVPNDEAADMLPLDLLTVEVLQSLRHARLVAAVPQSRRLRLTLALSCWDELNLPGDARPEDIAYQRLALLDSYCRARWPSSDYRVVGLSSQGRVLSDDEPAEEFIDLGPQKMGWLIDQTGAQDPDLTKLVTDE